MADEQKQADETDGESIDYGGKQAEIDKAKQKARDADAERLAEESK
jgi:hypothetical protein